MQRRGECTEEELKKQTLTFDVQSLSYLDLSRRGLESVTCVQLCEHLRVLNVSCNSLPTLTPLTTLTSLEELYAASNQITELEGFGNLSELKKLDLTDNAIQKLEVLLPLSALSHLKHLTLQQPQCKLSNPVCREMSYATFMHQTLPHLLWLDGRPRSKQPSGGGGGSSGFHDRCDQLEHRLSQTGDGGKGAWAKTDAGLALSLSDPFKSPAVAGEESVKAISQLLEECSEFSSQIQQQILSFQGDC